MDVKGKKRLTIIQRYIAHNLHCVHPSFEGKKKVTGVVFDEFYEKIRYHVDGELLSVEDSKTLKFVLHPKASIIKNFEYYGYNGALINELLPLDTKEEESFDVYGEVPEMWTEELKSKPSTWPAYFANICYIYNVDIHNLIGECAVDINTL